MANKNVQDADFHWFSIKKLSTTSNIYLYR